MNQIATCYLIGLKHSNCVVKPWTTFYIVLRVTTMKPEHKAAVKVGSTAALVTAGLALLIPSPAAWAAAIYGTYRLARGAYQQSKEEQAQRDYWQQH